ncbi:MAG TPA: TlpA disulfide reductase family protein [Mucilaginibacter sp.]|nr:TlpA disulfide reductase family protein [Mucilaginibacter sp.]
MKTLIILITCLTIQFNALAQTTIKIILKTNVKVDSVSVIDASQKEFHAFLIKDTLDIRFNKQNIDLYNIRYTVKDKIYWKQVWLNAGNVTIKAHTDTPNLIIDTVINSPIYYSVINYNKTLSKLGKDTVPRNNFMLSEIGKNLENPRSIAIANDYINFNQNARPNLLKLKKLLSEQKADFSWFIFYKMSIDRMNKILTVKNIRLSDFKFVNRQNKMADINLTKYDYYLLDFWFVGCAPCMRQHKEIKARYLALRNKKIGVVGISTDKNFRIWDKYLSEHGYNWDNYRESGANTLTEFLGVRDFPQYLILDKYGTIISHFGSWDDVYKCLNIN